MLAGMGRQEIFSGFAVFALASLLAAPAPALGACAERSVRSWPEAGGELPRNGRILLEGYGRDRAAILELAKRGPRLLARGHEVELRVEATYLGYRNVAMVILAPVSELRTGLRYRLAFARAPRDEANVLSTERAGARSGGLEWTASEPRGAPPLWTAQPWFVGFEARDAQDHPRHARIAVDVAATGSWRLVAQVEGRGRPQRYLVEPRRGEALLGGDDCAAAFGLEPGERYRVTLSAMDLAGSIAPAPGKVVEIAVP